MTLLCELHSSPHCVVLCPSNDAHYALGYFLPVAGLEVVFVVAVCLAGSQIQPQASMAPPGATQKEVPTISRAVALDAL